MSQNCFLFCTYAVLRLVPPKWNTPQRCGCPSVFCTRLNSESTLFLFIPAQSRSLGPCARSPVVPSIVHQVPISERPRGARLQTVAFGVCSRPLIFCKNVTHTQSKGCPSVFCTRLNSGSTLFLFIPAQSRSPGPCARSPVVPSIVHQVPRSERPRGARLQTVAFGVCSRPLIFCKNVTHTQSKVCPYQYYLRVFCIPTEFMLI